VDSFLSFIVRLCDSVRSQCFQRDTLCGERNESPSFSKRHSFSPNVARLSKLLTVGSIYRSLLKAPRAEQFHCNGFLCRTLVEKHPILKVNFSRLRLSHLTFSADSWKERFVEVFKNLARFNNNVENFDILAISLSVLNIF